MRSMESAVSESFREQLANRMPNQDPYTAENLSDSPPNGSETPDDNPVSREMAVAVTSWAIYGTSDYRGEESPGNWRGTRRERHSDPARDATDRLRVA